MKFKDEKRYITITSEQVRLLRDCLVIALNDAASKGKPTEDISSALLQVMKLGRKRKIRLCV